MREKAATCSGCGTRRDEWQADPDAYISVHETCPGCQRLEEEQANVSDSSKGVKLALVPREAYFANRESYE